jgi:hypothetical protein
MGLYYTDHPGMSSCLFASLFILCYIFAAPTRPYEKKEGGYESLCARAAYPP